VGQESAVVRMHEHIRFLVRGVARLTREQGRELARQNREERDCRGEGTGGWG